jgi:hypothetical protein
MTDYGTIKIPRDAYERHNQRRQDANLTWQEYLNGEAPDVPNHAEGGLSYDDVVAACGSVIESKLSERALE